MFGWARYAERIVLGSAWRLGQLVRIGRVLTGTKIAALLATATRCDLASQRDRTLRMARRGLLARDTAVGTGCCHF